MSITKKIVSMLRVNHAGEYGAVRICLGHQKALQHQQYPCPNFLSEMLKEEKKHLESFSTLLKEHKVNPSLLLPLWHFLSYGLGYVSARINPDWVDICTHAIEEVIAHHYQEQLNDLKQCEHVEYKDIEQLIFDCHKDETAHRTNAIEHQQGRQKTFLDHLVYRMTTTATKTAIFLSKRI